MIVTNKAQFEAKFKKILQSEKDRREKIENHINRYRNAGHLVYRPKGIRTSVGTEWYCGCCSTPVRTEPVLDGTAYPNFCSACGVLFNWSPKEEMIL